MAPSAQADSIRLGGAQSATGVPRTTTPFRPRRRLLLAALAGALGCTAALSLAPGTARLAPRTPAADGGLSTLPLAAQGPISELLGRGASSYAVHDLHAVNAAQRLRLAFSTRGVSVATGSAKLGIALSAYGYGDSLHPVASVAPRAGANRVTYAHGSLTEWYANGPIGLEQGFTVASRPGAGSGPLTLSLALSGGLAARLAHGSVLLEGHGAALRYGGLVVTDARGHTLRSSLALVAGRILIRVDDQGAAYPLRIDPLMQSAELTALDEPTQIGDYNVATSGTAIAVGFPSYTGSEGEKYYEGAVYLFQEPETGWANATETAKLTPPGKAASEVEEFGHSVAISGDTLVVGTPSYNDAKGAVYIYEAPAGAWASVKQQAVLTASDAVQTDSFGWSVALSGKTIAVGAPGHSPPPPGKAVTLGGSAYVFVEPGTGGWATTSAYSAELNASGSEKTCAEFGESVATTETTVVVGAPATTQSIKVQGNPCKEDELAGQTYVFVKPSSWPGPASAPLGPINHLVSAGSEIDDQFGGSVAISSDAGEILSGAPGQKVGGVKNAGAAYAFTKPEGGWSGSPAQSTLSTPAPSKGAEFGASVGLSTDGGTAVVSQPNNREPTFGTSTSAGYVFSVPSGGGTATLTGELSSPMNQITSVAISGSTIVGGGFNAAFVFAPLAISVSTPGNGASYTQGQTVAASYECVAPAGETVESCAGTVPNGAPIETSTLGIHNFIVKAKDSGGAEASALIVYRVLASSSETHTEATSTTATTPSSTETPAQKAAAEAARKARLEKEAVEFAAWIQAVMSNPENAANASKLLKEGGIPVSYKLVPEPGLIATTGSTVTWNKPTGTQAQVSSHKKPVVVFKLSYRITKAGKVSFKVPLTSAGRKLLEQEVKAHRSLVVYWTVTFTPLASRPVTETFKVTLKPGHAKKRRK